MHDANTTPEYLSEAFGIVGVDHVRAARGEVRRAQVALQHQLLSGVLFFSV